MKVRTALLVILALTALGLDAKRASACSCVLMNVRVALADADGAFVGTLLSRGGPPVVGGLTDSGAQVPYVFEVETVLKGDIPDPVTIMSSSFTESCGIGAVVGDKVGLLVYDTGDGTRTASLCSQTDPATLLAAAAPFPDPNDPQAVVVTTSTSTTTPAATPAPAPGEPTGGWPVLPWAAGSAIAALLAVGWAALRRRT